MSDEQTIPFAIVPAEVVMDTRLTLETMRVLVTLYSFRNKNTGLAFPGREAIAERCGLHPSNISNATTKLVELGWLVKQGSGGFSKATRYTIVIPNVVAEIAANHKIRSDVRQVEAAKVRQLLKEAKVAQSATVAEQATIAQSATPKVAESAIQPIAQSATRIEQTNITNQLTVKPLSDKSDEENSLTDSALQAACRATWKSYSAAYFNRHGIEPIRNKGVNSFIKQFVQKLPYAEAPHVAAFFVAHNDKYYIQKTHPVSLLFKDAEGLRTQWATGRTMTATKATQLDKTASNFNAAQEAIEMMRKKNHASV